MASAGTFRTPVTVLFMSSGAEDLFGQGSLDMDLTGQLELSTDLDAADGEGAVDAVAQARQSFDDLVRGAQ